jgi:hypothetical protein
MARPANARKKRDTNGDLKGAHQVLIVHRMTDASALSWSLMPQFLERVTNFCITHQTDTPPDLITKNMKIHFANSSDLLGAWAVMAGSRMIGHFLSLVESVGDKKYVLVYQAETDEVSSETTWKVFDELRAWCDGIGITEVRMVTPREASAFERRYGFERKHQILRLDLTKLKKTENRRILESTKDVPDKQPGILPETQ